MITLEELSRTNIHAVLALDVAADQKSVYPRSNAESIVEGYFPPDDDAVWMRAICNHTEPVGFMMTSESPESGEYFLWRMMIDQRFQGCGYGFEAISLLLNRIKQKPDSRTLYLSHLSNNSAAGKFYRKCGFVYTGEKLDGEDLLMSLRFDTDHASRD